MELSLATILDELNLYVPDTDDPCDFPFFTWVRIFNREDPNPDPSYFYVALLSEYLEYRKSHPKRENVYCLCLRDRITNTPNEKLSDKITILEEDISLPGLFNRVQDVFIKINDWNRAMKDSVLADKGIQDLLDISEPILLNHVSVMDNTFALIAHSRKYPCDDPVVVEFVKNGYHPDEMIQKLMQYGHIAYYKKSNEIYIDRSYKISKYIGLEKAFSNNGNFTVQVIMNCNFKYNASTYILFLQLIDYIKYYVDSSEDNTIRRSTADPTSLLQDLLEDKIKDEDILIYRTRRINLPVSGCFNIYIITTSDISDVPIQRISHEILQQLGSSTSCLIHNNRIILLNQYVETSHEAQNEARLKRILAILRENGLSCGVSSFFNHLRFFSRAVQQADKAWRLLEQRQLKIPTNEDEPFISYEDAMLFDYIRDYYKENEELVKMTSSFRFLLDLQEYDKLHQSQNVNLLRCYLAFDRNAAKAAAVCHMHRNNALYHINKMKESLGDKFDDPLFREQLMTFLKLELFN